MLLLLMLLLLGSTRELSTLYFLVSVESIKVVFFIVLCSPERLLPPATGTELVTPQVHGIAELAQPPQPYPTQPYLTLLPLAAAPPQSQACIKRCGATDPTVFPVIIMGSICDCMPYDINTLALETGGPCDAPCAGDGTATCGGPTAFDLYQILPAGGAWEGARSVHAGAGGCAGGGGDVHGELGPSGNGGVVIFDLQHEGCFQDDYWLDDDDDDGGGHEDGDEFDDFDDHYNFYRNVPDVSIV